MLAADGEPQQLRFVEDAAEEHIAGEGAAGVVRDQSQGRRAGELGGELRAAPRVGEGGRLERRHRLGVAGDGAAQDERNGRRRGAHRRLASSTGSTGFGAPGTVTGGGAR